MISPTVSPKTLAVALKKDALELPVTSDTLAIAQGLLQSIHDLAAAVEKQRKADKVRPWKECQEIDARAKEITSELSAAEAHLKASIGGHLLAVEREAQAAESAALALAATGASEALTTSLAVVQEGNATLDDARARGATGRVKVVYVAEVTEPALLPERWWLKVVDVKGLASYGVECGREGKTPDAIPGVTWREQATVGAVKTRKVNGDE